MSELSANTPDTASTVRIVSDSRPQPVVAELVSQLNRIGQTKATRGARWTFDRYIKSLTSGMKTEAKFASDRRVGWMRYARMER